jgi:hypothetical protein
MRTMILGLSTSAFTWLHVAISIAALVSGLFVVFDLVAGRAPPTWTAVFLATTILTSATGFFFHSTQLLPSHVLGILSLVVLAVAVLGLYLFHLAGPWRWIYVVGAVIAVYFNVFVAVVQAFQKIPALQPLAPTQSEPPFLVAQLVVLVLFTVVGVLAVRRFHPAFASATAASAR